MKKYLSYGFIIIIFIISSCSDQKNIGKAIAEPNNIEPISNLQENSDQIYERIITITEKTTDKKLSVLTNDLLQLNKEIEKQTGKSRQNSLSLMRQLAKERKTKLKALLDENPMKAFASILFLSKSSQLPAEIQDHIEDEVSVTGTFEVRHIDREIPKFVYFLVGNDQRFQVYIIGSPSLSSGTKVRVQGYRLDDKIVVFPTKNTFEILSPEDGSGSDGEFTNNTINITTNATPIIGTVPIPETLGEQKTVVILIRFLDSPAEPFLTVEQAQEIVFNDNIQRFYRENSFEKMWLSGDVFGWYTVPRECGENGWGIVDIEDVIAVSDDDIFFPRYERIIVISDDRSCGIRFGGAGTIGKWNLISEDGPFRASVADIVDASYFFQQMPLPSGGERNDDWTNGDWLLSHEFGHNLDFSHANNWECGTEIRYGDCQHGEYGNFFDDMGRGYHAWETPLAALHFNAVPKKRFRWLDDNSVLKITQNGNYILKPLEKPSAVIAKITQEGYSQIPPYYLEYRIPFGFDESLTDPLSQGNLGGIFINIVRWVTYFPPGGPHETLETRLLDMSPTTSSQYDEDWYNVALLPGETFFDEGAGIRITNIEENISNPDDPKIIFSTEFFEPRCLRFNPHLRFWEYDLIEVRSGNTMWIPITLRNSDSIICSSSTFDFSVDVPNEWNYSFDPEQLILDPDESSSSFFEMSIPPGTPEGDYLINLRVTNIDSGLETMKTIVVRVIEFCDDSDGGLNTYNFGTVNVNGFYSDDYCLDGQTVMEHYCIYDWGRFEINYSVGNITYKCPYGCNSGECEPNPNTNYLSTTLKYSPSEDTFQAEPTVPIQYRQYLNTTAKVVKLFAQDDRFILHNSNLDGDQNDVDDHITPEILFQKVGSIDKIQLL